MKMKRAMLVMLVLACCTAWGIASAQTDSGLSPQQDYACKVALCMANPNGPMAVQECVPPIKKLYKELAKGKPWPHCNFLGSNNNNPGKPGVGGGGGQCHTGANGTSQCIKRR